MLVVREEDGEFLTFGNSRTWEYPDAAKFRTVAEAVQSLYKSGSVGKWEVIRNYGMDTEEVVTTKKIAADTEEGVRDYALAQEEDAIAADPDQP